MRAIVFRYEVKTYEGKVEVRIYGRWEGIEDDYLSQELKEWDVFHYKHYQDAWQFVREAKVRIKEELFERLEHYEAVQRFLRTFHNREEREEFED